MRLNPGYEVRLILVARLLVHNSNDPTMGDEQDQQQEQKQKRPEFLSDIDQLADGHGNPIDPWPKTYALGRMKGVNLPLIVVKAPKFQRNPYGKNVTITVEVNQLDVFTQNVLALVHGNDALFIKDPGFPNQRLVPCFEDDGRGRITLKISIPRQEAPIKFEDGRAAAAKPYPAKGREYAQDYDKHLWALVPGTRISGYFTFAVFYKAAKEGQRADDGSIKGEVGVMCNTKSLFIGKERAKADEFTEEFDLEFDML